MPYISTDVYYWPEIEPKPGEGYQQFMFRCIPALKALDPELDDASAEEVCNGAWNDYVLSTAVQATVVLERDVDPNSIYNDSWYAPWRVKEIIAATMPTVTYSVLEKTKAPTGDSFRITKSVEEKQILFGWANVAKDANGNYPLDWDGDVTTPEELENAAYTFVLKYRATGEMHEGDVKGQLIESVMFTKEKQEALGIPEGIVPEGWWVGFHIPDKEVFAKIKSGDYEMLSVQGKAKRLPTGQ